MATLSSTTCISTDRGFAPMARRMPISWVRSRTLTNMMLLTPTMPLSSVKMPMIHIDMLSIEMLWLSRR